MVVRLLSGWFFDDEPTGFLRKGSVMKKFLMVLGAVVAAVFASSVAFAQDGGASSSATGLIALGSCFAIAVGAFGAASAQGRATGSAVEGVARNPSSQEAVFKTLFLPLIFMELQALFALVIAFMWYTKG